MPGRRQTTGVATLNLSFDHLLVFLRLSGHEPDGVTGSNTWRVWLLVSIYNQPPLKPARRKPPTMIGQSRINCHNNPVR